MDEKYLLRCLQCGSTFPDAFTNSCSHGHYSLIRTEYRKKQIETGPGSGMFRFSDWLPVEGTLPVDSGPVTFRSSELARELGLTRLFIGFSGYWPEKNANVLTCSFKELEAYPTLLRFKERKPGSAIVVASAGNTARAFAQVSALTKIPVVLIVPESSRDRIWTMVPLDTAYLVTVRGDYSDAIAFSQAFSGAGSLVPEGGAKNVARRDGMGTVMLDAAITIGRMPDHYFQAVGSGTGGIAAWEAGIRLLGDGRFGTRLPRLHLSQNLPFTPMVSAFRENRREFIPEKDMPAAKEAIAEVYSDVLTNRNPPYGIVGGTYDALSATRGRMYAIPNEAARSAGKLFTDLEGIDLDPAAAVAAASLISACEEGVVGKDATILLNITGGGYKRVQEDYSQYPVEVAASAGAGDSPESFVRDCRKWVNANA